MLKGQGCVFHRYTAPQCMLQVTHRQAGTEHGARLPGGLLHIPLAPYEKGRWEEHLSTHSGLGARDKIQVHIHLL